jgi:hypothetical protein
MHGLFDFDFQTKLLHVGYSVLGMLVSMVVLVKFKPPLLPRMIVAVILGFALVYCLTTTGTVERVQTVTCIGWFVLGLLFGIGRGEFVIEYLAIRFFGASPIESDPATIGPGAESPATDSKAAEGKVSDIIEADSSTVAVSAISATNVMSANVQEISAEGATPAAVPGCSDMVDRDKTDSSLQSLEIAEGSRAAEKF